jgi:hypothetical protein
MAYIITKEFDGQEFVLIAISYPPKSTQIHNVWPWSLGLEKKIVDMGDHTFAVFALESDIVDVFPLQMTKDNAVRIGERIGSYKTEFIP